MSTNRAQHIVILGAGAAGLTAAETLKELGYSNTTILERAQHAGGKCSSLSYEDQMYELGAGILASSNSTALRIAKKYSVPVAPVVFGESITINPATSTPAQPQSFPYKLKLLYQLLWTYRRACQQYVHIAEPGFAHTPSELCVPFRQWATTHNITELAAELEHFYTGFGYGYYNDVPAAYVLKYYPWPLMRAFFRKAFYKFPDGIQHLWTEVAKHHTVIYNAAPTRITRDSHGVTVQTPEQSFHADALILTTPLDEFAHYADASQQERNLFSNIRYCDYRTVAVFLKNFPKKSGYLPGNYTASRAGHPVFWYQRYENSNLYMFYVLANTTLTDDQIVENIRSVVAVLGGTIERVHTIRHWKYFPHVSSSNMRAGFFDQLEELQGKQHTYYAGELCNFSTVGLTAEYAECLIKKFFT